MTEEELKVLKDLIALAEQNFERSRPLSKCPDQIAAWNARGYRNPKYKAALKLLEKYRV